MVLEEAEDVVLWFSTLSDVKRINVMYGLLNKCLPFELRFLGACIEDCFKPYYQPFRELEYKANNPAELSKLTDLKDDKIRSRLITSIALLFSSNRVCSKIIFNTLTNPANLELLSQHHTVFYDELLLLFTLALKHPAFIFAQKQDLEWHLKESRRVQSPVLVHVPNEEAKSTLQACDPLDPNGDGQTLCDAGIPMANGMLSQCPTCGALSGPFGVAPYFYPTTTSSVPFNWTCPPPSTLPPPPPILTSTTSIVSSETSQANRSPCLTRSPGLPMYAPRAHVKHLELKNAHRQRKGDRRKEYRIQVTWSNGEVTEVSKTAQELYDFHQQQKKAVPTPTPYFAGPPKQLLKNDDSEDGTGRINEYLRQLMGKVPMDSDSVTNFFRPSSDSPLSQSNHTGGGTVNSDDQNVCSSPTRSNAASPSPTAHLKYSRASPVNAAGVNEVNQQLSSLTIYNSGHTNDASSNKTIVANSVPRSVRPATSTEQPVSPSHSKQPRHAGTQVQPDCNEEQVLDFERLSKTLEIHQKKRLPMKQILSLMDEQLKNDGFSTMQRRKILDKLHANKHPLPNGFCNQPDMDGSHRSSPSSVQSNCCTVQMVVMPDAPIDLLTSLCMDPLKTSHSKINRPTLHNPPDSPSSAQHAWHAPSSITPVCNGEVDDAYGEDGNYDSSFSRFNARAKCRPSDLNIKEKEFSRDHRLRRNSRGGGNGGSHPKMKPTASRLGDTGSRKASLTSPMETKLTFLPGCNEGSAVVKSPCSVAEDSSGPPNYTYANIPFTMHNGSSPLGISEEPTLSCGQGNNGPGTVGNLPATQNYNAMANGTYSPATSMVQPHTHMQPRLPSRPLNALGMCTTCPCTRPSTTPPPIPPSHPMYPPPHFILTAFPPNPATYAANGFVTTGVPPPHTFHQFMHSPEGMPPTHEVTFPHYVQQPQPPGVSSSQRMQHPPPVPGFVAGPTPNVGFHGNPMQPPTNLPPGAATGMLPPPPPSAHVPLLATVPNPSHKTPTCFNCGLAGHHGSDCTEKTMDDVSKGGQFQLSFNRGDKSLDGCE